MFNVKVDAVRVCNVPGKIKRFGTRSNWKESLCHAGTGNDINFMGAE